MKCEKCGRELEFLEVDMDDFNGGDVWVKGKFSRLGPYVILKNVLPSWVGNELSEKEQIKTIRCPHCHEFPFRKRQIDVARTIDLIMYARLDEK